MARQPKRCYHGAGKAAPVMLDGAGKGGKAAKQLAEAAALINAMESKRHRPLQGGMQGAAACLHVVASLPAHPDHESDVGVELEALDPIEEEKSEAPGPEEGEEL